MERTFKIGATIVKDPLSGAPFSMALENLRKNYPMTRHTIVYESEGVVQADNTLQYDIAIVPAKTNG
ncbi:hypothetical protein [Photobacterium leiognathi]|uniref:hypothetical protein n=1 Tax=Photobacterium leiognathi TaxID=553611 RepID=UPI002980FAD7|nr:hypothetical protein [Photobacterium leiognathi]